jgi:hypothetical protein
MRGQPDLGAATLQWDVTKLEIAELGQPPANIVPAGGAFTLTVTFRGVGFNWNMMEGMGTAYRAHFYAEGLGLAATEADLGASPAGTALGPPAPPGGPYLAQLALAGGGGLVAGTYRISCVVDFPAFPQVNGFSDELIIQVY